MRTGSAIWALLALQVSAYDHGLEIAGLLRAGGLPGNTTNEQLFETAGRHPNATSSIAFTRVDEATSGTWNWRVNITTLPVPDDDRYFSLSAANRSEDLNIVNTQWQLQWPDKSDSLQSYLGKNNMTLHVNTFHIKVPSNITSRYNAQANGNCSVLLGEECTQSLTSAVSNSGDISFMSLDGCADSLLVYEDDAIDEDFEISPDDTDLPTLKPDGTLFFYTSKVFSTDNLTMYHEAESALNLLSLDFRSNDPENVYANSDPSLLCQIVDKTAVMSGAVAGIQISLAKVVGMMMLGILFVL